MSAWAPLIRRTLVLPRWQAVACIVGASVLGSIALTVVSMTALGAPQRSFLIALGVATFVPTMVATPVGMVLTRLLHELDAARALAQTLANTDPLTGALNRRHFMETGSNLLARAAHDGTPMTVMMLDIDDFKRVNDRFGHQAGDDVLHMFARTCMQTMRSTDLLARWGGEEFIALLPGTAAADATRIAARLCCAIAAGSLKAADGQPINVTASIGLACGTGGAMRLEDLVSRADAAMYEAKRSGKNRVEHAV